MVVVGILIGLATAGGLAFLICSIVLVKSNDFGNTKADIDDYTGYSPVQITNEGQVSNPASSGSGFMGKFL